MAFNISEFSSVISDKGLSKGNKFKVRIFPPKEVLRNIQRQKIIRPKMLQYLEFYAKSVTLPELDVQTTEVQPQGFGPIVRRPQNINFPVLPVVFNVDQQLDLVQFFHQWTKGIINYDSQEVFESYNGALPFELGYKQDYASHIQVMVYDDKGEPQYKYQFSNAYPVNVGNIEASWENNDETLTISVGFTYDRLRMEGSADPEPLTERERQNLDNKYKEYVRQRQDDIDTRVAGELDRIESDAQRRDQNQNIQQSTNTGSTRGRRI